MTPEKIQPLYRFGLLGKKRGMTQIFEDGKRISVTVIELSPNTIIQKKAADGVDGYGAVQLGLEDMEHRKVSKPLSGHFKRADAKPKRYLRELRISDPAKLEEFKVGQDVTLEAFKVGTYVDVTGRSKGKGFAGVMKRHNMKGSKQYTHGTHEYRRHGGSIGMRTTPGRVHPGKRMAGQMGNARTTIQNLKIVKLVPEQNLLLVEGAVPGCTNGVVLVREAIKKIGMALRKSRRATS